MLQSSVSNQIKYYSFGIILAVLFSSVAFAQNTSDDQTSNWLNSPILVEKRARRTSVWKRKGESNVFIAKVEDKSLEMTVSANGTDITIKMKDPKNKYSGGKYTGEIKNGYFSGYYQIQFVRRGPERTTIYSIRPGADLSDADLSGADLSGANLTGANLEGADLTDAIASRSSTKGVDFKDWARRGGIVKN